VIQITNIYERILEGFWIHGVSRDGKSQDLVFDVSEITNNYRVL